MDVKNKEYLTFESTDRFKGLLIILIVIGHIKGLTSDLSQSVLYTFNVSSFLFLPFLFNADKLTSENAYKIMRRYFVPYTIFFIISYIAYHIVFHTESTMFKTVYSWLFGTPYLLKQSIGFSAYWFFPALIFLLFILMIYNSLKKNGKIIFLIIMLISHLCIGVYTLPNSDTLRYAPFVFYITLYLFFIGILIKSIMANIKFKKEYFIMMTLVFTVLLFLIYGGRFNLASPYLPSIFNRPLDLLLRDFVMVTGFFSLLYLSSFFSFLAILGKYSLVIYTIHPLLIQAFLKINNSESLFVLLVKLLFVLLFSLGLSLIIYKFKINTIMYPR